MFWKLSGFIDKYRILVYITVTVLIGLGFDFKTPHMMLQDLRAEVMDSLSVVRHEQASLRAAVTQSSTDRMEQRLMLEALVRVQCSNMTPREQKRLGLPCDAVSDITHSSRSETP